MLELYKNIRKYRLLSGMTQTELSKRLGYRNNSNVSKIERGKINITQGTLINIANILGVSPSELLGDSGYEEETLNEEEQRVISAYRALAEIEKDLICRTLGIKRVQESSALNA